MTIRKTLIWVFVFTLSCLFCVWIMNHYSHVESYVDKVKIIRQFEGLIGSNSNSKTEEFVEFVYSSFDEPFYLSIYFDDNMLNDFDKIVYDKNLGFYKRCLNYVNGNSTIKINFLAKHISDFDYDPRMTAQSLDGFYKLNYKSHPDLINKELTLVAIPEEDLYKRNIYKHYMRKDIVSYKTRLNKYSNSEINQFISFLYDQEHRVFYLDLCIDNNLFSAIEDAAYNNYSQVYSKSLSFGDFQGGTAINFDSRALNQTELVDIDGVKKIMGYFKVTHTSGPQMGWMTIIVMPVNKADL